MRGVNGSRIPPAGTVSRWPLRASARARRRGRGGWRAGSAARPGRRSRSRTRCARASGEVLDRRALARRARLEVRVDGVERDQFARELDDVVHGRVYGITEMSWQHDLADALVDAGVEVAAWVPDKRLAPIGERLVERGLAAADAHPRGGVLRLRGRLPRRGRDAARAAAVLGTGQLVQRARLARHPVRLRLPGGAVDARDARGAQPVADAARPHDRRACSNCSASSRSRSTAGRRPAVVARGAVASAEGARVLAPIILESILDLA